MRAIQNYINGKSASASGGRAGRVYNPNTGAQQAELAFSAARDVDAAVQAAAAAFPGWAATNPQRRARVMFAFKQLVEKNMDELAHLLSSEHGKVIADSKGDIQRGLEVIEFACGIPHALKGEYTEGAGPGIDVYSMRQPLGVCAGITPFNFPAMIPMWMFGIAIAVGNTFVLKPSEKDPSVPVRLAELMMEAGAPAGVLNVVHGDKEAVDAIIAHPEIKAISFVGSSDIAHYIYSHGTANHKRVQAMGGAKNHGVVMPDADMDQAVKDLVGAAYGSAGERCMALPVVVPVGKKTADELRERLIPEIEKLKVGISTDADAQYGPVVSSAHKAKIEDYIGLGVKEGAELVRDGRGFTLQGYEEGFFVGPTLFDNVKTEMRTYQEEIFGPVLQIMRAESFEEALALPSQHQYGNGVAIFTRNGRAAREFASRVNVGMVGINVPIPVPVAYHTFGGWKRSAFGDTNQHGMEGVKFFTKVKTITARWPEGMTDDFELRHSNDAVMTMSVVAYFAAVSPDFLPTLMRELENGSRSVLNEQSPAYLDKAWHGIHYLLTGEARLGEGPLSQAVLGGTKLWRERDLRMLAPDQVAEISAALSAVSFDAFCRRYDANAMMRAEIYPVDWDEEDEEFSWLDYLESYFADLVVFYRSAARKKFAVLPWIS